MLGFGPKVESWLLCTCTDVFTLAYVFSMSEELSTGKLFAYICFEFTLSNMNTEKKKKCSSLVQRSHVSDSTMISSKSIRGPYEIIDSWAASCLFPPSLQQVTMASDTISFLLYWYPTGYHSVWSYTHWLCREFFTPTHLHKRTLKSSFTPHCALAFTRRKRWRWNRSHRKGQYPHFSVILKNHPAGILDFVRGATTVDCFAHF